MNKSSRRIFIKSSVLMGLLSPIVNSTFATNKEILTSEEKDNYFETIKAELTKEWPKNRTINLVFHGHSVPSGYFVTPDVRPLESYPFLLLKALKKIYPFAVINIILTCIGGENSESGAKRFKKQVLCHQPDVLFIDYALNDTGIGVEKSRKAMEFMIKKALQKNIKVILLTPTPDQRVELLNKETVLQQLSNQVVELSKKYEIGLIDNYSTFQNLAMSGEKVTDYMSQVNHPNEKGHQLIVDGILKYF
jgi:acyl-CoA thioesterase I